GGERLRESIGFVPGAPVVSHEQNRNRHQRADEGDMDVEREERGEADRRSPLASAVPPCERPATLTSVKGSAIVPWINVPVAVPRTATATPYHGPSTIADTAVPIMSRYSARWSVPTTA